MLLLLLSVVAAGDARVVGEHVAFACDVSEAGLDLHEDLLELEAVAFGQAKVDKHLVVLGGLSGRGGRHDHLDDVHLEAEQSLPLVRRDDGELTLALVGDRHLVVVHELGEESGELVAARLGARVHEHARHALDKSQEWRLATAVLRRRVLRVARTLGQVQLRVEYHVVGGDGLREALEVMCLYLGCCCC